jgi:hypothetical protein
MLKQYLTKVIAVATIAAGSVFIAGCAGEETSSEDPAPSTGGEEEPKEEH